MDWGVQCNRTKMNIYINLGWEGLVNESPEEENRK